MPRPRRRTPCASRLAKFSGSRSAASELSRPTSAADLGPRLGSIPEEIILAALALELDHPVRWIEDRNEHLLTCAHARDHHYRVTAYADRQGHISSASIARSSSMPAPMACGRKAPIRKPTWRPLFAGPLCDPAFSRAHLDGRDQQDADRPVSRRWPPRRLLCRRADDRRNRARGRPRPDRGAHREHDPARTDALHVGHRHALRQRRLSRQLAALRRPAEPGAGPRAPAARRTGWAARRHRLRHLQRADRPWRRRIRRSRRRDDPRVSKAAPRAS